MVNTICNPSKKIKHLRVLVVDDNPFNRRLIKYVLSKVVSNVITAANGKEAYDILQNEFVDLIILDVEMPFMNGLELLNLLKKDPDLSKIKICGFSTFLTSSNYRDYGFDLYLKKSPSRSDILKILNQAS